MLEKHSCLIVFQNESDLFVMNFSAEYCLPLVRIGGLFVAPKGHDPKVRMTVCFMTIYILQLHVMFYDLNIS